MMLKSTTLLEQLSDQEPSASRLMLFLERSCPSVNEIIPLTTITYHLLNYKILKKYSMREKVTLQPMAFVIQLTNRKF